MTTKTRNGQPLTNLPAGDKRRLADGRNAWRKMTPEQRREFLAWMAEEKLPVAEADEAADAMADFNYVGNHNHY